MSVKTSFSNLCTVLKTVLSNKLDKLTYEYNKALNVHRNNKICIGKFPCYDTNITISISLTTKKTYNGTLIVATQNIGQTDAAYKADMYGDYDNYLTNCISLSYNYESKVISIYINPDKWSKLIIHIKCVNLIAVPTEILTFVTDIPDDATITVNNITNSKYLAAPADDSISTTSTNAIQNKAVGLKFQGVDSEISGINSSLTAKTAEIAMIVNEYGSKNLVDTSLITNSTGHGVTRKNNGDGSITYSGTSTATNAIYLPLMNDQNLGKGTYIFTPNPMTDATYIYQIYKNGRYWKNYVLTQTIEITEAGKYSIGVAIKSNATISNTFKPMLRYAAIKDDTYVPYAMTNRELTEKVIDTGWITTGNLKYRKSGYIVALQGSVTPSDSAMSITLGTLPENCRPSQDINIAQAETDTPSRKIIVQTNGNVVLLFASNCTASHTYAYNGIFMI